MHSYQRDLKHSCRYLLVLPAHRQMRSEKVLDLSQNKLDAKSARSLCSFLASPTCRLKELLLAKADMDDGETAIFMEVHLAGLQNGGRISRLAMVAVAHWKRTKSTTHGRHRLPRGAQLCRFNGYCRVCVMQEDLERRGYRMNEQHTSQTRRTWRLALLMSRVVRSAWVSLPT